MIQPCKNYTDRGNMFLEMKNILLKVKKSRTKQFDLGSWEKEPTKHNCNTCCCIAGYAAKSPIFNKRGFHLTECNFSTFKTISFNGHTGYEALSQFFNFNTEKVNSNHLISYLFRPCWYNHLNDIDEAINRLTKVSNACFHKNPTKEINKIINNI